MPDEATSFRITLSQDYEINVLKINYDFIDEYYDTTDPDLIKADIDYILSKRISEPVSEEETDYTALLMKVNPEGLSKIVSDISSGSEEPTIEEQREIFTREEVLGFLDTFEELCRLYQSNESWFSAKKAEWIKNTLK
jgi:hypothetical protein